MMMNSFEITTFRGSPEEAATFLNRVWQQEHAGKMIVPVLDAPSLRWRLPFDSDRELLLGAYAEDKLIGTLFALQRRMCFGEVCFAAGHASWLAIERGHSSLLPFALIEELTQRLEQRNIAFVVGAALNPAFWLALRETFPEVAMLLSRVDQYFLGLDQQLLAQNSLSFWQRLSARFLGWAMSAVPKELPSGVRLFQPADLPACQRLLETQAKEHDLAYGWSPELLGSLLVAEKISETLVLERGGELAGLVTWIRSDCLGRGPLPMGRIEFAAAANEEDAHTLLLGALARMKQANVAGAILLAAPPWTPKVLSRLHFMKTSAPVEFVTLRGDHSQTIPVAALRFGLSMI
jgi:hypothetical protein